VRAISFSGARASDSDWVVVVLRNMHVLALRNEVTQKRGSTCLILGPVWILSSKL
jgi:hypothetical protein